MMHEDFKPTGNIRLKKGFIQIYNRELDCGAVVTGFDMNSLSSYVEIEGECVNPKGTLLQTHSSGGLIVGTGSRHWFAANIVNNTKEQI